MRNKVPGSSDVDSVGDRRRCRSLGRRAVEVAFKKPRFFRFLKKPKKNPKVQILGFLGFLFLKIVILLLNNLNHIEFNDVVPSIDLSL